MTQKLVLLRDGDNDLLLLLDPQSEVPLIYDDATSSQNECCCSCDGFPGCLACLDTHTYTSSQSVAWPEGVTTCTIECWGRGGAGGDSQATGEAAGGGGGGGFSRVVGVGQSVSSLDVIVNDSANDFAAEVKQNSLTECLATAGMRGDDGPNGVGGTGGGGDKSGGNGANGIDSMHGGGGGGGAGSKQSGQDADEAAGGAGGIRHGGDGGDAPSGAGQSYGGGGAGGFSGASGGAPGQGAVRISWWYPMKLTITLSGAPSTEGTCDCPETNHDKRRILWDNLNSTFQLEQETAGSHCFKLDLITNCDAARDGDAILIEDDEFGCCTDESGGYELHNRSEVYVSSIWVCLECTQNKMRVATISFNVCGCEQHVVGPPPLTWSDWSCSPLILSTARVRPGRRHPDGRSLHVADDGTRVAMAAADTGPRIPLFDFIPDE